MLVNSEGQMSNLFDDDLERIVELAHYLNVA